MQPSFFIPTLIISLFVATFSFADSIELKDGSKLVGEITQIKDNKLVIKTAHCGELTIDRKEVIRFQSTEEMVVATIKGDKISGTVENKDQGITKVSSSIGSFSIKDADIDRLWSAKLDDPTIDKTPATKWAYELAASANGKTGNSESLAGDLNFKATMTTKDTTLILYAGGAYEKTDRNLSSSELLGGIDFEQRFFSNRHSWYIRDEMQRDNVINQDFRNVLAVGYGYYVINNDKIILRFRAGLGHTFESYDNADDKSSVAMDFGGHFNWKISDNTQWFTDVIYEPSLDDFTDCRIFHESKIRTKLAELNNCSLEAGVNNEYYSVVEKERDYLDSNYFIRIVFGW